MVILESTDSDANEEAEAEDLEPDIDEQSDGKDNRQAHEFLHTSPNQVAAVTTSQPLLPTIQSVTIPAPPQPLPIAGQDHLGFTVSMILSLC